jgi:hypothetical protein
VRQSPGCRSRALSVDDDLSYLREFEHITMARVLLAQYNRERTELSIRQATGLMARLLQAAEEGDRTGSASEMKPHPTRCSAGDSSCTALPAGRDRSGIALPYGRIEPGANGRR